MESVLIGEVKGKPEECLNLKSEVGGRNWPGLTVSRPKEPTQQAGTTEEGAKMVRIEQSSSTAREESWAEHPKEKKMRLESEVP